MSTINESVDTQLERIAKGSKPVMVSFPNGETALVDPRSAKNLLDTKHKLSGANATRFTREINQSPIGFIKALHFANKE